MEHKQQIIFRSILYSGLLVALVLWAPWGENFENVESYFIYYLILAGMIWFFGYRYFGGKYVKPKWKIPGKFIGYIIFSFVLLCLIKHYAIIFIIGHQAIGGIWHYYACKKHNIDFWTCEPEAKYIALTEKWAKGEFN